MATTIINTPVHGIAVEVTRKSAKNLNLRVRADGTVALSIPWRADIESARAFVARKEAWIAEHVSRRSGAGLEDEDEALRRARKLKIEAALPAVVERLETEMGVHASSWSVRHMKTRWGSCTPATGAIRINSRLADYPPECLEFVVAHELVHLMEPSHNKRFHMLLDVYCPKNGEAALLLRRGAR